MTITVRCWRFGSRKALQLIIKQDVVPQQTTDEMGQRSATHKQN